MDNNSRNMLLMSYSKYFSEENLFLLRQKIETMDDNQVSMLYSLQLKDPIMSLILSLVAGPLGIDRFFIGDTLLGVLKLITCGGFGIWAFIDYFLIMKATKDKNFHKLMAIL